MKDFADKFLKLSSTVRLSFMVSVLLVLAIGLSFSNTFFAQKDDMISDDSNSSRSVLAEATGFYVSPTLYCLGSCATPTPTPSLTPTPSVNPPVTPTPTKVQTGIPTVKPCPSGTTSIGQTTSEPPANICVNNTPTPTMEPTPTQAPTSTPKPTKAPTPTFIPCPSGTVPIGKTLDKPTQFICGTPTPTNVPEPTKCIDPVPSVTPDPTVSPIDALIKQIKDLLDILCKSFGFCDTTLPSTDPSAEPSAEPTQSLSQEREAVLRIEAGGMKNFKDKSGNVWQKDKGFVGGDVVDRGNIRIGNTANPKIYQTEHWGMSAANYKVPDGDYVVRLHFAETYSGVKRAGQRVFDIDVNGEKIKNLDVFKQAKGRNKALIKSVKVKVIDGKITFKFKSKKGATEINGIEILKILPFCEIEITPTLIPSISISPSIPASSSPTLTPSISVTISPTASPTATIVPTATSTPTAIPTPTLTPSPTASPTATLTPTTIPSPTLIATNTPTISPTAVPSNTISPTIVPSATSVPTPTTTPIDNSGLIKVLLDLISKLLELIASLFK